MNNSTVSRRSTGFVKWFNHKKGFGFITVCSEGEHKNEDIFVHYKSVRSTPSQCNYLVQGEYVDFDLVKVTNNNHTHQACDITGVNFGHIMSQFHESKKTVSNSNETSV